MKKVILAVVVLLSTMTLKAQINAVTETGEEVILFDNNTWVYVNDSLISKKDTEIEMNNKKFKKNRRSTFTVKSKKANIGICINPKKWSYSKSKNNPAVEYQFKRKEEDLYAMLITEKAEIPLETLKKAAIINAKNSSKDLKVIHEEYRIVNGIKVIMLEMNATVQGMKFTYIGYYYSNEKGSYQLLTYSSLKLIETYRKDIEVFLNGLIEI
jgi:hypothetical protein